MTESLWLAIIAGVPSLIGAISLFYIRHLEVRINSRMSELIEVVKMAAHAEGLKQGRAEERPS